MKLNEKINLIREELNNEIKPIDTKQILDNAHIAPRVFIQKKQNYFSVGLRTAFLVLIALAIIIPSTILLSNGGIPKEDLDDSESIPNNESIDSTYGFVATSAVALSYNTNDIFNDNDIKSQNKDLLIYEELNNLNRFIAPIGMMLAQNDNHYYRERSDNNSYANKIVFEGKGLIGERLYYKIYFNETLVSDTKVQIDTLVVTENKTIFLKGERLVIDKDIILTMKYYIDERNLNDYIQVSKNFNNNVYEYKVVKDDNVISNSKLTLLENDQRYAKLESISLAGQLTTFKVYSANLNTFQVEYSIRPVTSDPTYEDNDNEYDQSIIRESGNIAISMSFNSFVYNINSKNFSDSISFENHMN